MNIHPTLDLHNHNEFHFAAGTDSKGCCCYWSSKTPKPKEYKVNDKMEIAPCNNPTYDKRSKSNKRLEVLIKDKLDKLPMQNDIAFGLFKDKINEPMGQGDPITSEKLDKIIQALFELRMESRSSPRRKSKGDSTQSL